MPVASYLQPWTVAKSPVLRHCHLANSKIDLLPLLGRSFIQVQQSLSCFYY